MFEGADLLVVSHTKSGRTWLRVMLSHLWHLKYGVPADELVRADNLKRLNSAIPSVHFARDTRFPAETGDLAVGPQQKLLILFRDPRDVAVSFWFHVRHRASEGELERKGIETAAKELPLYRFVTDPGLGVPRIVRFYNRWLEETRERPRSARVRYEDLRRDAGGELRQITEFLGDSFTPVQIEAAVEFAAFDNLKDKERQGYFASGRLGPAEQAAVGEEGAYKVREGSVGGWRQRVTAEEAATIDRLVEDHLDPTLGYSRS